MYKYRIQPRKTMEVMKFICSNKDMSLRWYDKVRDFLKDQQNTLKLGKKKVFWCFGHKKLSRTMAEYMAICNSAPQRARNRRRPHPRKLIRLFGNSWHLLMLIHEKMSCTWMKLEMWLKWTIQKHSSIQNAYGNTRKTLITNTVAIIATIFEMKYFTLFHKWTTIVQSHCWKQSEA